MTEQERKFKESVLSKIKEYKIPTTFNDCLKHANNEFTTAYYKDGSSELINIGIEKYLYKLSPLLFLEKNAIFDLPGHGEVSCKELYFYQKQILLDFQNHKRIVLTKSRQVGLSTLTSLIFFWKAVNFPAQNLLIISKDGTASQEFLEKVKTNVKYVPQWLGISIKKNNVKSLEFSNKSKILSFARSKNAGRSFTGTMAVLDEAAFYQTENIINGIVASVVPTLQRVSGTLFVISTPNGTTGEGKWYYEQVQNLRNAGGVDGDAVLYDIRWWMCPDIDGAPPYKGFNDYLANLEKKDYWHNKDVFNEACEFFKPIAENPKTNPWLKFAYQTEGEVLYRQEILQDFVVMGNSVFSKTTMEKVQEKVRSPIKEGDLGKRHWKGLWFWQMPEKGHRYGLGCLPPGEKVYTSEGLKNIESITLKDKLISQDGKFINIINKQEYNYCNEKIFEIKPKGILHSTTFTGEHPILSSTSDKSFKFRKAKELRKGDWLVYPNIYKKNTLSKEEILSHWDNTNFKIPKEILLDKDFWWYVGMWLAKGWIYHDENCFSMTNFQKEKWTYYDENYYSLYTTHEFQKEKLVYDKIRDFLGKYNLNPIKREKKNTFEISFCSRELFFFFSQNFGKYTEGKQIPEWVKRLPKDLKVELLKGYWGNSTFVVKGKYQTLFTSTSKRFLADVQDVLFSLGIISSEEIKPERFSERFYHCFKKYQLSINNFYSMKLMDIFNIDYEILLKRERNLGVYFNNDLEYIYLKVEKIKVEHYKGKVYNFETEDHTFLCKYLTTHNCDVAKGTADDSTSVQVLDIDTGEQVAEYLGRISTKEAAKLVCDLGSYYNNGYIFVECNSIGEAVFNDLYYNYNYENMYKMKKINKHDKTQVFTGWMTTTKSRELITDCFIDYMADDDYWSEFHPHSQRLVDQMKTWIWSGGRPDHMDGSHDDDIFAMAILLYNLPKAKQLLPKEGEIKQKTYFIGEDGKEINLDSQKKQEETEYEDEEKIKNLIGFKDDYGSDIMETYKWLMN